VRVLMWRCLLPCLLILATASVAQDADDLSPDDYDPARVATLSLQLDRQGSLDASLDVPVSPASPEAMQSALTQALYCPAKALDHPSGFENRFSDFQKNWTAAQRERYQQQMAKFNERRWTGKCDTVLARQDGLVKGDFDYSAFAAELHRSGVEQLNLYVDIPRTQFQDYTQTNLQREPLQSPELLVYQIPLAENSKPPVLHLAYGFQRNDLYRGFAILAGFLLIPVMLTLWMRRRALASAGEDAAASWFGYFKTLSWVLTGAMLLWITSGLGARRVLQDWVADQGLSTWSAAAADVFVVVGPAFLIYLFCIALSFPVYARLRGGQLSRREFLLQQLVAVGAQVLPLMLGLASLQIIHQQLELSVALLILTVVMLQVFKLLKLRVLKNYPQALTTGELRDRIFALAARLGVTVTQVFVIPAGKGQVANAYAAKNKIVMFTDYLLEHLSKREVDAIAAHELAHLQHKHPGKRGLAFIAAIFLPSYFTWLSTTLSSLLMFPLSFLPGNAETVKLMLRFWAGMNAFNQWSLRDFVLVMLGLTVFYFLSRRFENVADAAAVRLTGDPEAQITGLLKVNRLNRTPIQWGKASESWLTHPSTVRRVERIAAAGGMAPERLHQILQEYSAQSGAARVVPAEDRYIVPIARDPERARTVLRDRTLSQGKLWLQFLLYVVPPALISLLFQRLIPRLIPRLNLGGIVGVELAGYLAGIAITAALVILAAVWLGQAGRAREKRRIVERFAAEHVPAGRAGDDDIVVGFAPGPYPRLYQARYHWDSGFLVLAKDRLQFVGEQLRFSLLNSEIDGIVVGRGGPSWWNFERVYVRWRSVDGTRSGIFNLNPLEAGSIWRTRARVRALCRRLQLWQTQAEPYPAVRPEFAELRCPELGEVTCQSPRLIGKWSVNVKLLAYLLPLGVGVGILLHAGIWSVCSTAFVVRMIQSVPYWRYRDVPPPFPPGAGVPRPSTPRVAGASAGDSR
jgi:Zn-dependent protease with chaperone function